MNDAQVQELLYQPLETELGGVKVYEMAISCAVNEDLRKEWEKYGAETRNHVQIVEQSFGQLGLDTATETPGREVVRHKGQSLLEAMEMAKEAGDPAAAELVGRRMRGRCRDQGSCQLGAGRPGRRQGHG